MVVGDGAVVDRESAGAGNSASDAGTVAGEGAVGDVDVACGDGDSPAAVDVVTVGDRHAGNGVRPADSIVDYKDAIVSATVPADRQQVRSRAMDVDRRFKIRQLAGQVDGVRAGAEV